MNLYKLFYIWVTNILVYIVVKINYIMICDS